MLYERAIAILLKRQIASSIVDDELHYAFPFAEKRFKRGKSEEPYISRRNDVLSSIQNRLGQSQHVANDSL